MKPSSGHLVLGIVVGLLIGLLIAIGVSFYMNNVPIPFVDKLPQRTGEQDAEEAQRNQNWNPNAPLSGKTPPAAISENEAKSTPEGEASKPTPAMILNQEEKASSNTHPLASQPISAANITPLPNSSVHSVNKTEITGLFIQAGAFWRLEDAEQQRAKLAMLGLSARIFEREQNTQILYRVRLGPFENRDDTSPTLDRLQAAGVDANLVRVERAKTP